MTFRYCFFLFCCLLTSTLYSQNSENNTGRFSGSLLANGNIFLRDSLIGAANIPQYDRQLYGAEAWLNLNYSNRGFDVGVRFDLFNNSNLLNPTASYSDEGLGMWYARRQIQRLHIWGGYIYDQIGSGIIFRAFEERPLLIDNALVGLHLRYDLTDDWRVKAFTGRQKQLFETYEQVIKGVNIEGYTRVDSMARFSVAPGIGLVSRTLDDAAMNSLVATLNTYPEEDRFVPKYNTYAFTAYNTLSLGAVTWYAEAAFKTDDNLNDPFGAIVRDTTTIVGDKVFLAPGSVIYNSLSYAADNWGLTLEAKRTENFSFRTRPQVLLNRGLVNFLPPLTRVNTYRLTSRYNAATQELGEWAFQADLRLAPTPRWSIHLNGTLIDDLEGQPLYRELYTEATYKYERLWRLTAGVQMQRYNQERYEFKPGVPLVETLVPFVDFQYKLDRRQSVRTEFQYMKVGKDETAGALQDYGNWLFGLLEYNLAPHWTFSVADMYNVSPGRNSPRSEEGDRLSLHYPRVDVFYTSGPNRFSASYVKQVEGVVCTGGICRLEPAFSGVKLGVSSTF